jgi:hypothetical protein
MSEESKRQVRNRLLGEGRWAAFTERRKELQEQGRSAEEAHQAALEEFPPLQPEPESSPEWLAGAISGDKREALAEAAWWAANAQRGDKAPSPLAAKFQALANESPGAFVKGVLLPLLPKVEGQDAEKTEREKFIERQNQVALDTLREFDEQFHRGLQHVQCVCGEWSERRHPFCPQCGRKKVEQDAGDTQEGAIAAPAFEPLLAPGARCSTCGLTPPGNPGCPACQGRPRRL